MLELKNVGFQADDDNKEILRDVSLKIDDKIVVITGPNGGGKSTLATVIAGIVKPTRGHDLTINEACAYLSEVGLCAKDYIDRELNASLSGGEIKRIEIATILARGSKFSVFDEPEAGIDLWSFRSLIHVFEKMQRENNGTILIISHQERILNIADKIIYIKDGMVEKYGPKDEVLPGLMHTSKAGCDVLMNKMED